MVKEVHVPYPVVAAGPVAKPFPLRPALPPTLQAVHMEEAVEWIEEGTSELVDLYYKRFNFSRVVGYFGAKALAVFTAYKRLEHSDITQQRFPDLSLKGRLNPPPEEALESKGSIRPWAVQSHYDHPGWYIVWRYTVDPTRVLKPGREVVIWRVDVAFLRKEDWKYEKSTAGAAGGGRTHTFGLRQPAERLRDAAAYRAPGIVLKGKTPILIAS